MLETTIIIALLATTVILLFKKWKWLDYYQAHYGHIKWLPSADCYLCLGFWISVILSAFALPFSFAWIKLLIPFCTIPIITFLTHIIILHEGDQNQ